LGKVIAIEDTKGGVGKSNTAVNLAHGLQKLRGMRVCIIDRDVGQESVTNFYRKRSDNFPAVFKLDSDSRELHKVIHKIAEDYDIVLIDGAAQLRKSAASSILASDGVIIPLQPSVADIEGLECMLPLIADRQTVTEGKPLAAFLINRNKARTNLSKMVSLGLARLGQPILDSRISDSVVYSELFGQGLTVFDADNKKTRVLANEFKNLIDELERRNFYEKLI
jgi:chromosome partitioning protein